MHARLPVLLVFLTLGLTPAGRAVEPTAPDAATSSYSFKIPARDGIGKVYMGREISFVMGHRGRGWLERPSREREERTDLLVGAMQLDSTTVVADIGAGSGYFAFRMSPSVDKVLTVDIQPEMLAFIEERTVREGVDNIETVLGTVENPNLPEGKVDAVLMVDAYHEFSHPHEMMHGIFDALKPGGRVYLVEYRGEEPEIPIYPLHKMTVAQARLEMEAIGLEFVKNRKMLPTQHFMIFRKPEAG